MNYVFNDRDLRVKKDVSDLEPGSLILEMCSKGKPIF